MTKRLSHRRVLQKRAQSKLGFKMALLSASKHACFACISHYDKKRDTCALRRSARNQNREKISEMSQSIPYHKSDKESVGVKRREGLASYRERQRENFRNTPKYRSHKHFFHSTTETYASVVGTSEKSRGIFEKIYESVVRNVPIGCQP